MLADPRISSVRQSPRGKKLLGSIHHSPFTIHHLKTPSLFRPDLSHAVNGVANKPRALARGLKCGK